MWLVPRIDSPSETSAGSMLTGSDEAANTMVPPCWLPPPAPPPDPFSSPHAVATSASAANRTSRRIPRGRCNAHTAPPRPFPPAARRRDQCQRGQQDEQANPTWTLQCPPLPPGPPPSAAGICQIGPHGGALTQCLSG